MILKGRLKLIYDMIPACDILSDIGTDHALIPAYALMNKRCKKAIACDIRKGPLERAERTLKEYFLQDKMELRLGSGLDPISKEEADCIVIAGMGGILITELLKASMEKAQRANYLILQPMVGQEVVRPFLWENGFEVLNEGLVNEEEKLYQVLTVRYTGKPRAQWNKLDEVIGERLITKKDPLLAVWVADRIRRQRKIVHGLSAAKNQNHMLLEEQNLLNDLNELLYTLGGQGS